MFDRHITLKGLSKNTKSIYLYNVRRFFNTINKVTLDISLKDIEDYILEMIAKGYQKNTIRINVISLKMFFSQILKKDYFILQEPEIPYHSFLPLKNRNKGKKRPLK